MSSTSVVFTALYLAIGGLIPLVIRLLRRSTIQIALPGPQGGNFFYGHLQRMMGPGGHDYQEHIFSAYGTTTQIRGVLYSKALFTIDPMIIGNVLIKEKNKFERPHESNIMVRSIFGGRGGLLGITSDEHRTQRKMPVFLNTAKEVCAFISRDLRASKGPKDIDVLRGATASAIDLIGEIGFGYSFNSLKEEYNQYSNSVQDVTQSLIQIGPLIQLLPYIQRLGTPNFRRWMLEVAPFNAIQKLRRAIDFQNEQADKIILDRQKLISSGADMSSEVGRGRDIVTLFMRTEETQDFKLSTDREVLVGHMNVFIAAGHETTSTAVARILDELSRHPDVQNTLRDELNCYFGKNRGGSDPKELLELPYLDGVVREVLRLHPPFTIITRVCQEDTVLPLAYPVNTPSGKFSSIPIKKGTVILINNVFFNRHEHIWGERAGEFLPERWIGKRLHEVTQTELRLPGVYSSMMTFGAGSYGCIGMKFAVMEIKTIIAALVRKFRFRPAEQECTWVNIGMQFPYLKTDVDNSDRLPKLFLKVEELL